MGQLPSSKSFDGQGWLAGVVRGIGLAALALLLATTLIVAFLSDDYSDQLTYWLLGSFFVGTCVTIVSTIYLMFSIGGIENIGEMTFSKDGLAIKLEESERKYDDSKYIIPLPCSILW